MKYSVYRFTLDIHVTRSQVSIPVLYRDTGIRFLISLSDGGKPYVIQDGNLAVFFGKKADGTYLTRPCTINNNTEIQYDFTDQTTSYEGIVNAEIRLFGTDDGTGDVTDRKIITSPSFTIVVDPKVLKDEDLIESVTETSPLDNVMLTAIEKVSNAVNKKLPDGVTLQVIESDIEIDGDLVVRENLTIDGDLEIKGATKSVSHETLTVNDNIIITNAGSTNLNSLSGIVINTGETDEEGNLKGYGIVYEPASDSVKLGLGIITKHEDTLAEFAFAEGEAQAIVTRGDDFDDAASDIIPMWDSVKKTLVPSGKTAGDFVPKQTGSGTRVYVANNGEQTFQYYGRGAFPYYLIQRESDSNITLPDQVASPPNQDTFAISKGYADAHYVPSRADGTLKSKVYVINANGNNSIMNMAQEPDAYTIVSRTGTGQIKVPTAPELDTNAISKGYADGHYVPLKTNTTTLNQVYAKTPSGEQTMVNMGVGAESGGIAVRDTAGQIRLPNQINTPPDNDNMAISKGYADTNYRKRITNNSGSYLYAHVNGEDKIAAYGTVPNASFVIQRTSNGNVRLPDQITTPPTNVDDAVSKAYVDNAVANAGGGGGGGVYMHRIRFDLGGEHAFLYVEIYNTSSVASSEVFDVLSTLSNSIFPKMAIFYDTLSHETASAVILSAIPGTQTITYSISGKQTVDTAQFDSNAQVDDQVKPLSDLN